MSVQTLLPSRMDIPADARTELVTLLNARLADSLDYAGRLKQAHWNVKGMQFVALHEMLDTFFAEATEFADSLAERAVMLGGIARGTVQVAATQSALPDYPTQATGAQDILTALADSVARLGALVREAIDLADAQGDADTADLFTEVSRGLDKQLWYFEAHLAG